MSDMSKRKRAVDDQRMAVASQDGSSRSARRRGGVADIGAMLAGMSIAQAIDNVSNAAVVANVKKKHKIK